MHHPVGVKGGSRGREGRTKLVGEGVGERVGDKGYGSKGSGSKGRSGREGGLGDVDGSSPLNTDFSR